MSLGLTQFSQRNLGLDRDLSVYICRASSQLEKYLDYASFICMSGWGKKEENLQFQAN